MSETFAAGRSTRSELLDAEEIDPADLRDNLSDLRRLNVLFGGVDAARRGLQQFRLPLDRTLQVLDVGTGSADVLVALQGRPVRRSPSLRLLGLDRNAEVLAEARRYAQSRGMALTLVRGDALRLPFRDRAVDVALCTLTLHHFPPEAATELLRELGRVSRLGVVVVDLYRSKAAYVGAWLATRVVARHRMTRRDGPLSVLRAYTPSELVALAHAAGLPGTQVEIQPWFRMTLVARFDEHQRA